MRKVVLGIALAAAAAMPNSGIAASAKTACYSANEIEAEQAIRFVTDLMVASSTCQNTTYAEFRNRNQAAIVAYQKALIRHFHGAKGFDAWNTSLANLAAQRSAGMPSAQVCQQAAPMMQKASALDSKGFHDYAVAQAAAAGPQYTRCGKGK